MGGDVQLSIKPRQTAVLMLLLLLASAPAGAEDGGTSWRPAARLQAGSFLFAVPELRDPNFYQSVILLVDYGPSGAMGLIINRATDLPLSQALSHVEGAEDLSGFLYFGGPVGRHLLLALLRSEEPLEGTQRVFDGVYFTQGLQPLTEALAGKEPDKRVRVFGGYAGWAPGQLEREVRRGDWVITRADADQVFAGDPDRVWPEIFEIQEQIEIRGPAPDRPPYHPSLLYALFATGGRRGGR